MIKLAELSLKIQFKSLDAKINAKFLVAISSKNFKEHTFSCAKTSFMHNPKHFDKDTRLLMTRLYKY